ncbi:hypothetical protein NEFER03_0639 [Nematocida sp. LUAm3]|nr:hypothetical protein NEFER03_0639 [Nematocida sp. LUAm3]KAI5176406.1 hypothetical protein NEFER02_2177 [Nematocida sp. LUAm2]KAI5179305.1 hypothetical protein NEFER01_2153 [Nematocida sp. LUAm1]
MWVSVYGEGRYSIEKRIKEPEEEKSYSSHHAYIEEECTGRYRVRDERGRVVCGSLSFNLLLKWIEDGELPSLLESCAILLNIGNHLKSYVFKEETVILCARAFVIFTQGLKSIIEYQRITGIEKKEEKLIISVGKETKEIGWNENLEKEIFSLSLHPLDEDAGEKELVLQCISERLCEIVPIYHQRILTLIVAEEEALLFTEDFLVIKKKSSYLGIPMDMIRKIEVVKGWSTIMKVKDANQREFQFILSKDEKVSEIAERVGRKEKEFKAAYINGLLDMIEIGNITTEDQEEDKTEPISFNGSSEYKTYIGYEADNEKVWKIERKRRPWLWMEKFSLCGMAIHSNLYSSSLAQAHIHSRNSIEQIEKDVLRSSYEEISFSEGLKKVLLGFSSANQDEYLQSHSLVAAVLFRVLGESNCFFALYHIFSRILPGYSGPEIHGMRRDVCVLLKLVEEKFPGLYVNLMEKSIEIDILVTPWIIGIFTTVFSRKHIERVFDQIAIGGAPFIFKLCLALLERMYKRLSWSEKNSSILKASKEYLFSENSSVPSIDDEEFSILIALAIQNKFVTHERIHYERQKYEIQKRAQSPPTQ